MTTSTFSPSGARSTEQILRSRAILFLHLSGLQFIDLLRVASGEDPRRSAGRSKGSRDGTRRHARVSPRRIIAFRVPTRDFENLLLDMHRWLDAEVGRYTTSRGHWRITMEIDIDPALFRFVPTSAYVREVYFGWLLVLTQHYNDPICPWEQKRALDAAASLLRYRWSGMSAHQRLRFLAAIESRHSAPDED